MSYEELGPEDAYIESFALRNCFIDIRDATWSQLDQALARLDKSKQLIDLFDDDQLLDLQRDAEVGIGEGNGAPINQKSWDAAEVLDEVLWKMPYFDPERAVRIYERALSAAAPERYWNASTVANGIDNLIIGAGDTALRALKMGLNHPNEDIRTSVFETLEYIVTDQQDALSPDVARRLRIIHNTHK